MSHQLNSLAATDLLCHISGGNVQRDSCPQSDFPSISLDSKQSIPIEQADVLVGNVWLEVREKNTTQTALSKEGTLLAK